MSWKRWAFAIVPLVGLFELANFVKQSRAAPPDDDWIAARDAVRATQQPGDLVVFAPRWADPLGRRFFGKDIASVEREARPDEERFARAIEVSIRGQHAPELRTWKKTSERQIGKVTLTVLDNPQPVHVLDDLVTHVSPEGMRALRFDAGKEQDCAFTRGGAQTGNLGFGPAIPGDKFQCSGGSIVGVTVVPVLDYAARRCILATPPAGGSTRLVFKDVSLGNVLHGHHGIYVEAERAKDGAPVTLVFSIGDKNLGRFTHVDGDGWKGFELVTSEYAGQKVELVAEVSAPSTNKRTYCFEAITW